MKAITLKKKWVEKLEEMDKELKFKCLAALYEFLLTGHPTIEMMQGFEVAHFIKFVMEDVRKAEERRERNRQRRAEKAARKELYAANPELHIFDGFMRYVIATGDSDCCSIVPSGMTLDDMLFKFRDWVITRGRSREITRLTAFRGLLRHAVKNIA